MAFASLFGCEPPVEAASPEPEAAVTTTFDRPSTSADSARIVVGKTCEVGELARCLALCGSDDWMSCNNLGAMAELGRGTNQNLTRALSLYDSACSKGAEAACLNAKRLRARNPPKNVEPEPEIPVEASVPSMASEVASTPCSGDADCEKRCHAGDAESCKLLPGIHIQGNVEIQGNVQMFGNVYLYGPNVHIEGDVKKAR